MHKCPICDRPIKNIFQNGIVCGKCALSAVDSLGHRVVFFNVSVAGVLTASHYSGSEVISDDSIICFIDARKCSGIELRFGGTAILCHALSY